MYHNILRVNGKLPHFGYENFIETFYHVAVSKWVNFTADYQLFVNPGYNTTKGPISVFSGRITLRFQDRHWTRLLGSE